MTQGALKENWPITFNTHTTNRKSEVFPRLPLTKDYNNFNKIWETKHQKQFDGKNKSQNKTKTE
jgi:hypothetical protein